MPLNCANWSDDVSNEIAFPCLLPTEVSFNDILWILKLSAQKGDYNVSETLSNGECLTKKFNLTNQNIIVCKIWNLNIITKCHNIMTNKVVSNSCFKVWPHTKRNVQHKHENLKMMPLNLVTCSMYISQ